MQGDRLQRQIERLLDEAEAAIARRQWDVVRESAQAVLRVDPANRDALGYLVMAGDATTPSGQPAAATPPAGPSASDTTASPASPLEPTSFCDGRYEVRRFLGEGGKKLVYLAHDTLLDRDVAFALIKTEGLDEVGRERIRREAQAMGRLGAHPHVVSVFDLGDTDGQPFIVTELMGGGDVEGLIEKAPDHRVPLADAIRIADEVCRGLEFAHSKQIVHRDLKPGNVWLTADGTSKIGDFGLAVATDRGRLTQPGLMVGTVSYMPPEQAMGGEVTPRSDLYSLGAMLYELVTGRPPYVGDESVAIITQHLNTPPVAPSWHVPDLPPGLEALILRLLEKDPNKRPASAPEVRKALEAVRPPFRPLPAGEAMQEALTPTGSPDENKSAPLLPVGNAVDGAGQNPVYRRIFVGREAELRQLQATYDAALSGQGALVMAVGEPGIGKTALTEQLATYVAVRGGRTLVGHCYEEGSLTLPYLPFVEALRSYALARDPDQLRHELGSGAAEVARIVSEIRDRVRVELPPPGDPEDDRWRLFQAVTGFLKNASDVQPLLLILEDLHWADRGSLDYLLHLSRNLAGTRLLVVGTYRDIEVDRAHPLSAALAELRRIRELPRVLLRGLTPDEVHRMISSLAGEEMRWSLAEAVHRQTEGNPLFIQEVLRFLVEEGLISHEGGRWHRTGDEAPELHIPEGLRDVIGRRLSRLSAECNRLLSIAAVIGREFDLQTLREVAEMGEETLLTFLEESLRAGVLEEHSQGSTVRYRFTHAFFQQTLYEEIIAPRRIRLHQQVGRAIEHVYARRLDEHAAEMAEHFSYSSDRADLAKAVAYGVRAAERATAVFAYGEAAHHLERCLQVQEVFDPEDKAKRCDLLLALGEAMLPSEEPQRAANVAAPEAFALAELLGDRLRAARAAVIALEAIVRATGPGGWALGRFPGAKTWLERADQYAVVGTPERVYADVRLGMVLMTETGPLAGHPVLRRAVERAHQLGEHSVFFVAAAYGLRYLLALRDRSMVDELVDEFLRRPRHGARSGDLGPCLRFVGGVLLERGDRTGAEQAWRELEELAQRTHDATLIVLAIGTAIELDFVDGRLEGALAAASTADARGEELGVGSVSGPFHQARALIYLGRGSEALGLSEGHTRPARAGQALYLAHVGRHEEARAIREGFGDIGADDDESGLHVLTPLFEAAILGSDLDTVRALARRLAPLATHPCAPIVGVSYARLLGDAAALLEERVQARTYYEQALDVCAQIRFRPEIALTHLHLAELLLDGTPDEQAEAQGHLDFAIDEFRAMKMQPSLERALRHKGLLHA
jgi:tetratricopeptide (TPR) repeat protein